MRGRRRVLAGFLPLLCWPLLCWPLLCWPLLACLSPAIAQPAPGQRGSCPVAIAFEPLVVRSAVGISNHLHGVVVVGGDAFEANPSGSFPNWGHLVGRRRDLGRRPLKDGHVQRFAGYAPWPCADALRRAERATAEVNAARLPYAPAPELQWNAVNSNSFAYYLVGKLGLAPPSPPPPALYGWAPGYNSAIRD